MDADVTTVLGAWWPLAAIVVAVLGTGRVARLLTYDTFPPTKAIRTWWYNRTQDREDDWKDLLFCPFCIAPWITVLCGAHFALGYTAVWIAWSWWIFWGWLAIAYLAAMVVARDTPEE